MERGEGSHGCRSNSKSSFESGSKGEKEQARWVREQDQYMPIANVIRIMRRILPPYAKISDDAKETMQECVSEYISFITSEANERCHREQRKTITAEDVLWAMSRLGFDNYVHPLTLFLNRYRQSESDRPSARGDPSVNRTVNLGPPPSQPPPSYGLPSFPLALGLGPSHQGMFDATTLAAIAELSSYYIDAAPRAAASSSPSSHNPTLPNFDPYAEFK